MESLPRAADIRRFLFDFFDDEELSTLCFDFFPQVHGNFAAGMTKQQKIIMLLEYCQHQEVVPNLTAALQRARPGPYEKRFPQVLQAEARPEPEKPVRDPKRVFISHAHQDAEFAHRLAGDLQQRGWRVWIAPNSIRPGEKWVEAINRGLDESGVFALVLTPKAVESPWVMHETNVAIQYELDGRLRFIPLEVEPCTVPPLCRAYQYASFLGHYQDGLTSLLTELSAADKRIQPRPNEKVVKLLAKAKSLLEKRLFDDAIRLLKEARSEYPKNFDIEQLYIEAIYAKAVHLYVAEHKLDAARLLLQEVVRLDPAYKDAARLLAEVEQQRQREMRPPVLGLPLPGPIWLRIGATAAILACIVGVVAIPRVQHLLWPAAMPTLTPIPLPPSAIPTLTASPTVTVSPSLTPTPTPSLTPTPTPSLTPTLNNHPLSPTPTMKPTVTLAPGATRVSDKDDMVMVYVPAGESLMGSAGSDKDAESGEKPQHSVYLDAFWIDRTEVTNAQYKKCVQAGVCKVSDRANDSNYNGDDQPVVGVEWSQAQAYCQWAGRQLPTEAQWEKAARGTDGRIYPWGDQLATCEYAVMNEGSGNGCGTRDAPWPVGSKPQGASPYGALDMAGNAWEWVADWLDEGYYAASLPKNPPGPSFGTYRVVRGGSYDNEPINLRASYRGGDIPVKWEFIRGFRCALWL